MLIVLCIGYKVVIFIMVPYHFIRYGCYQLKYYIGNTVFFIWIELKSGRYRRLEYKIYFSIYFIKTAKHTYTNTHSHTHTHTQTPKCRMPSCIRLMTRMKIYLCYLWIIKRYDNYTPIFTIKHFLLTLCYLYYRWSKIIYFFQGFPEAWNIV